MNTNNFIIAGLVFLLICWFIFAKDFKFKNTNTDMSKISENDQIMINNKGELVIIDENGNVKAAFKNDEIKNIIGEPVSMNMSGIDITMKKSEYLQLKQATMNLVQ